MFGYRPADAGDWNHANARQYPRSSFASVPEFGGAARAVAHHLPGGFEGTSVEEIAARAGVSKPVVYEHFGGKDGAYQAVVERETTTLHAEIRAALNNPGAGPRETLERGALALLDYIDRCPDGFRILSRDSSLANPTGSFASILSEIAIQVEEILGAEFARLGHDPRYAHLYAQALVGLVAMTGQQWLDDREPERLVVARHLINLAWNGMANLKAEPRLLVELKDGRQAHLPSSG